MKSVEDLKAWQTAMDLIVEVYKITKKFPKEEMYGLTSQLRRAAVSIAANIAEGFGRFTYADKANKYVIARGECGEVHTLLQVALRTGMTQQETLRQSFSLVEMTGKLLSVLIQASKENPNRIPNIPVL